MSVARFMPHKVGIIAPTLILFDTFFTHGHRICLLFREVPIEMFRGSIAQKEQLHDQEPINA